MTYKEYVYNFERTIWDIISNYIRDNTEVDDADGILIDYRTHQILQTKRSEINGKRGDFYSMKSLMMIGEDELIPSSGIISDIVSMYV